MSKDVLLDFDELEKEAGEQLQFQAFTMPSLAQSQPSPSFFQPDLSQPSTRNEELITPKEADQLSASPETEVKPSLWSFAYYQRLFDVDTDQVVKRIISSVVPTRGGSFYDNDIKRNPDLYGPFWICVTLIFSTAIAGNLYNYLMVAVSTTPWRYDFHKVPFAATAIFSYSWLLPLIIYGFLWWRKAQGDLSFLGLLCVYGYSLAIYIPVSLLWLIPVPWFQWTLVIVAAALSGSVLLLTLWPAVSGAEKRIAIIVMVAVLVFHMALAAGFLLYFFHVPTLPHAPTASPLQSSSVAAETAAKLVSKRADNTASLIENSNVTLPKLDLPVVANSLKGQVALQTSKSPEKMGVDSAKLKANNAIGNTAQDATTLKESANSVLVASVTNNVNVTSRLTAVKSR